MMDCGEFFLQPTNATHRQYEALRAHFVEGLSAKEVARRFGYTEGSARNLFLRLRENPGRPFFLTPAKGPRATSTRRALREKVVALRKENLSIYDIADTLKAQGIALSPMTARRVLKEEGFAPLPRRRDEERPSRPRQERAPVADVNQLDLSPRTVHTKFGGLFLFMPELCSIPLSRMLSRADFPGSGMIPADHAIRSLLALKLFGSARHSHVMSYVLDEGLALFAGLNAIPKRSYLTQYSSAVHPECYPKLARAWFNAVANRGLPRGESFDLDFHTIPFHGEEALVEKHYVSKRSRRQKGVLAFLARDADTRILCYGNANVRKHDQNDEILRFVSFWKRQTGHVPEELIFDSKLTTYANLNKLEAMGIQFITLRRRSQPMLDEVQAVPRAAWRRIELEAVSRLYRTPRILDRRTAISDYQKPLRELVINELGHEQPTFLLTNQLRRGASKLVERYAQRMIIENSIQDSIDFFHMDALSSAVPMKVDCDLQLTLMASSLYRLLGRTIGQGYEVAKSRKIFRDFIDATATIVLGEKDLTVRFQRRAHNPLLLNAGFRDACVRVPWLGRRRLQFVFG